MPNDLGTLEQKWLEEGITEELLQYLRGDPSMMSFALFHLEGIRAGESPDPGLATDSPRRKALRRKHG